HAAVPRPAPAVEHARATVALRGEGFLAALGAVALPVRGVRPGTPGDPAHLDDLPEYFQPLRGLSGSPLAVHRPHRHVRRRDPVRADAVGGRGVQLPWTRLPGRRELGARPPRGTRSR